MKRTSKLALAFAAGAFALSGAVMAQDAKPAAAADAPAAKVKINIRLDVGYRNQRYETGTTSADSNSGIYGNGMRNSYFGVQGEDLVAEGVKGSFKIETQINPTSSGLILNNVREGWAALDFGKGGKLTFGTQYTPVYLTLQAGSPGGISNLGGEALYQLYGISGKLDSNSKDSVGAANNDVGPQTKYTHTARASNLLLYTISPADGLTVGLGFGADNTDPDSTTSSSAKSDTKVTAFMVGYKKDALDVMLGYNGVTTQANSKASTDSSSGYTNDNSQIALGGSFNAQVVKVYATILSTAEKCTGLKGTDAVAAVSGGASAIPATGCFFSSANKGASTTSGDEVDNLGWGLGVSVPVLAPANLWLTYNSGTFTYKPAASGATTNTTIDYNSVQFGATYDYSKNTQAYFGYGTNTLIPSGNSSNTVVSKTSLGMVYKY